MKAANGPRSASARAAKRPRGDERMEEVIDRLCGCLTEGDALTDLEQEHRAEVLADERRHRP
jgi:hypothetical protein